MPTGVVFNIICSRELEPQRIRDKGDSYQADRGTGKGEAQILSERAGGAGRTDGKKHHQDTRGVVRGTIVVMTKGDCRGGTSTRLVTEEGDQRKEPAVGVREHAAICQ